MNSSLVRIVTAVMSCVPLAAGAYDLGTHARVTYRAYEQSLLSKDSQLLKDLGIDTSNPNNPFGTQYNDASGSAVQPRVIWPFEAQYMDDSRNPDPVIPLGTDVRSIPGWLMRGAIREDDLGFVSGLRYGPDPHDDPRMPFWRVMNHFYDPPKNRPLELSLLCRTLFSETTGDTTDFRPAPDWALGTADVFTAPDRPEPGRRNHFTVLDAREAMYRALTGRDAGGREKAATKEERNKYWATTFRALGDVVHLVQDMGQPQHTRNDPHAGVLCFGHESVYEKYVEARATQTADAKEKVQQLDPTIKKFPQVNYGDYPIARFNKYADFFSTARRDGANGGLGLADYSNRGFFSAGTNLGDNDYLLPPNDRHQFAEQVINVNNDTKTAYLLDGVFDRLNPALRALDVPKTKEGIWYEPLLEFTDAGVAEKFGYTLDQRIYDTQADLLIPRAVAYSAGLIDYFFRGQLEVIDPTFTDEGVSLKVRNAIDAEKVPEWAEENLYAQEGQGQFVVTVKYKQGKEEKLITSDPVNLTTQEFIKSGEAADEVLSFQLPPLPDDATDIEYRLVFRGRLGQEDDAIAVGVVEPASGFVVKPSYVPTDGIAGSRLIVKSGGKWRLTEDRDLEGGNIDWKGWYENGRPTKVLSWSGPKARYFPDRSEDPFGSYVYENGQRFAVSPIAVLGAAIAKDNNGKEWLMVIGRLGIVDVVLRRPNKKSDSSGPYDPVTRPDGWRTIGYSLWESNFKLPDRPWFFNGDGTEAQTMRAVNDPEPNKLERLRIRISADLTSAEFVNLRNLEGIIDTITNERETTGRNGVDICNRTPHPKDSDHWHLSVTRRYSSSGKYVVAVDYKDNAEVLGIITRSGQSVWALTLDYDWDCQKNTIFGRIADSQVETFSQEGNESTELHIGEGGKSIKINSRSASGYAERSQLTSDNTFRQGKGTVTESISSLEELIYLDLRNNLYVAVETRAPNLSKDGSIVDAQACFDFVNESAFIWVVSYTQDILVARYPLGEPSGRTCGLGLPGVSSVVRTVPVGTSITFPTFRTGATPTTYNPMGSWAVSSSGQLLVSQEFRDDDNQIRYFNFLTGGQLDALIPGAPDDAHYFSAAVVR